MLRLTAIAALVTLAGACASGQSTVKTQSPAPTETAVPSPQATPDNTPRPQHVSFATGEETNTHGQAGVVFVDPATGGADAWLLEGVPANYSLSLGASDGHLLLYRCQHPTGWASPAGCDPPNAWYLFDTQAGDRVRFDMFSDHTTPVVVWPEGDEVLGVTASGAVLVRATQPYQSRKIDVPQGYQLVPASALWDRNGTRLIVAALQSDGSAPALLKYQALLIDRSSGAVTQLGDDMHSFAWSPDGSMFAVTRASERLEDPSEIAVYSRDGTLLWSQPRFGPSNPSWSPDGASIAIQVLSRPERVAGAMRLDVLDAATGTTRYRIVGAIACEGRLWTADASRLILLGAYGYEGSVVADPRDGTLRALDAYPRPSVTEPNVAYVGGFDGWTTSVSAVNIDTGETRHVAAFSSPVEATTLSGSPLFRGRFAFIATEPGGRGGCAEAIDNVSPPTTHFEYPPFAD